MYRIIGFTDKYAYVSGKIYWGYIKFYGGDGYVADHASIVGDYGTYLNFYDFDENAERIKRRLDDSGLKSGRCRPFYADPVPAKLICGREIAINGIITITKKSNIYIAKDYRYYFFASTVDDAESGASTPQIIWGIFDLVYNEDKEEWEITRNIHQVYAGGGGGGDVNIIESISVNNVNIPPDANKNVNITVPQSLDNLGLYIDAQGYICQRIGSDT